MFLTVIKYFSYLSKFMGLSNLVIEDGNFWSRKSKILSFFIPITSIIIGLVYVIILAKETLETTTYILKMIILVEIVSSCYFLIITNIKEFHFKESFKQIKEREADLKKFLPRSRNLSCSRKLKIVLLINLFVFLGVLITFHVCNVGADVSFITYYNSVYTVFVIYNVTLNFTFYIMKINQQLECANEILENIIQSDDGTDILFEQPTSDDELENFFSKIYYSVDTIGNYFQVYFLGCLAYSTFQPLWGLYYIIVNFPKKTNAIVIAYSYWSFIQYFPINEWVWALTSLRNQILKLDNNFYKLALMFPDTWFYDTATSITLKLLRRKSGDPVAGVFPTDWTLNTWQIIWASFTYVFSLCGFFRYYKFACYCYFLAIMTSTIISYLVIILQFTIQEDSSDTS